MAENKKEELLLEADGEEEDQKTANGELVAENVESAEEGEEKSVLEPEEGTPDVEVESSAEPSTMIVKNASEGYGYSYASLADIAKAGVKIPKMRLCRENPEFLEYWDGEEWQLGSRIIIPKMSGVNAAQAYGSALTYARRYTTQLAMSVATDDDSAVENTKADGLKKAPTKNPESAKKQSKNFVDFKKIREEVKDCRNTQELEMYWKSLGLTRKQEEAILPAFISRKKEILEKGGE